jgi:hypothetical protein
MNEFREQNLTGAHTEAGEPAGRHFHPTVPQRRQHARVEEWAHRRCAELI